MKNAFAAANAFFVRLSFFSAFSASAAASASGVFLQRFCRGHLRLGFSHHLLGDLELGHGFRGFFHGFLGVHFHEARFFHGRGGIVGQLFGPFHGISRGSLSLTHRVAGCFAHGCASIFYRVHGVSARTVLPAGRQAQCEYRRQNES